MNFIPYIPSIVQGIWFYCLNPFHNLQIPLYSIMWSLQLLAALSGLAVIVVLGQHSELNFADPPPLPEKGSTTFLFSSLHT